MSEQDLEKGNFENSSGENIFISPTAIDGSRDGRVVPVITSQGGEIIHLANLSFSKRELMFAFGVDESQLNQPKFRPIGNPVPLGLAGFAICTFTIGMVFLNARGLDNPQLMAGCALFLGGIMTMVAGFWSLVIDATFAAAALGAFGGFYMSYAAILIDAFGITSSYAADDADQYNNIMGFYLIAWTIYAFTLWLCTWKGSYTMFLLLAFVTLYLLFLAISFFCDSLDVRKGAGVFALLSAFNAFYAILEGVGNKNNSYLTPPPFELPVFGA